MLDRQVLQIEPEEGQKENARPFSSYRATVNLIVLGDPGAGKTVLFRQSAAATDGHFITVRNFLNTPVGALPREKALWIDGLDETRSGRGDNNTIDRLVRKLHTVQPAAVRLSCRVADWLGTSDLKALASYFDLRGGSPVVVQLQPLTRDEQRQILAANGRENPDPFLDEAQRRGLDAMLSNPQTLLMLHLAVEDASWPTTRQALFEKATTLLLREHNHEHNEREDAASLQTSAAVRDAAGALCALRLVSECTGFSLQPEGADDMPGWREIPLAEPAAILAALKRRAFVAAGVPNGVDYLHRTVAEYLGAGWIAGKIAAGLPLGRVQALLGVEGQPASSLRGLHAWLAVHSPESAPVLIDADPMGIVMYADAAPLGPSDKRRLLDALSRAAERDPWFYHGSYAAYGVGALSDPTMVDTFRDLLRASNAPFALRNLVVDALATGLPLPALREDLEALLTDQKQPFALRDGALDALLAMDDAGRSAVIAAYPVLGEDENGLRLRGIALRALYGQGLEADDLFALIAAILSLQPDQRMGVAFGLTKRIPSVDAPVLLDRLDFTKTMSERGYSSAKTRDLLRVYAGLFFKAVMMKPPPSAQRIHAWLRNLLRYSEHGDMDGELVQAFVRNREVSNIVFDAWISNCDIDDVWPDRWDTFRRLFKDCFSEEQILHGIFHKLSDLDPEHKSFHYRYALQHCLSDPERWRDVFWEAYDRAEGDYVLSSVRDECSVCRVHPWRYKRIQIKKKEERKIARERNVLLRDFDKNRDLILSAEHLDWLALIGEYYFGFPEDQHPDPISRIKAHLGKDRTNIAINGLKALVDKRKAPALSEVIALHGERQIYEWWVAVLAGLDLLSDTDIKVNNFEDDYLQSVIAIACLYPVFRHSANSESEWVHRWLPDAILCRSGLVCSTYATILEADLARGERYPHGLDQIQNAMLSGRDRGAHIEKILRKFPQIHPEVLEKLLRIARTDGIWPDLQGVIEAGVSVQDSQVRHDTRCMWLAFGFMSDPERYRPKIESLEEDAARDMVWPLLKVGSLDFHRDIDFGVYDTNQLEYVAKHAARFFPYTPSPSGIISGRENPWDVSHAIGNALAAISASTDDAAHAALQRLTVHPLLASYAPQAQHLLAQQRMRRIDAAHALPDWQAAAQTLLNRAPASAQDLHSLALHHLQSVCLQIAHGNTDAYKRFWNENAFGRVDSPKSENSARDVLIDLLRPGLYPFGLHVEPEGDMARDKRADIVVLGSEIKCPIELKRDYHPDVWTAAESQLDRFYTPDPQASGHGIYAVFWYGDLRGAPIPAPPAGAPRPRSAAEMQQQLHRLLPISLQGRIAIVVIDVSGQLPGDQRDLNG